MNDEAVDHLIAIRTALVKERRRAAGAVGPMAHLYVGDISENDYIKELLTVQATIEAVDRALADEKAARAEAQR